MEKLELQVKNLQFNLDGMEINLNKMNNKGDKNEYAELKKKVQSIEISQNITNKDLFNKIDRLIEIANNR